jgi:Transcription termination factor nusG
MFETPFESSPGKLWTPVRTKPRREKKLAEFCQAKEITHYLPLLRRIHTYGSRTAEFFVPMFPSYIFCLLDDDLYHTLLTSHAVLFRINMSASEEVSLIEELYGVKEVEKMSAEHDIVVKPELVSGTQVRVKSGPLSGTHGIVSGRRDKLTLTINIELLGQSVSAEISAAELEED